MAQATITANTSPLGCSHRQQLALTDSELMAWLRVAGLHLGRLRKGQLSASTLFDCRKTLEQLFRCKELGKAPAGQSGLALWIPG